MPTASNGILCLILDGQYKKGLRLYRSLEDPSAVDDRWGGLCHHNLGHIFEAKVLLTKAVGRGEKSALIELATLHRLHGELSRAGEVLGSAMGLELDAFDQTLLWREAGAQALCRDDLELATDHLERAWLLGSQAEVSETLLGSIAQVMAMVLNLRGRSDQATDYLRFASRTASEARQAYVQGSLAMHLIHEGQYDEAERVLRVAFQQAVKLPLAKPLLTYYAGMLARARNHLDVALQMFGQAAAAARKAGEQETQCYAELGLCAVATTQGDYALARQHLVRARGLALSQKARAYVALREGALLTGEQQAPFLILATAAQTFRALHYHRELLWTWLHTAEGHLAGGDEAGAESALANAAEAYWCMDARHGLEIELRCLPRLLEHFARHPVDGPPAFLAGYLDKLTTREHRIELRTLGGGDLALNGRMVRFDLSRTLEFLAFLVEHQECGLSQIHLALDPDAPPQRFRNYFHQVRYGLEKKVPGLRIPFDGESRKYRLEIKAATLHWDMQETRGRLRQLDTLPLSQLSDTYRGEFLADSSAPWVEEVRADLHQEVVHRLEEAATRALEAAQHERALALIQLALTLEPLDEQLTELHLHIVQLSQGACAAKLAMKRAGRRYEAALGEAVDLKELASLPGKLARPRRQ